MSGFTSIFRNDTEKYQNIVDGLPIAPSSVNFGQGSSLNFYQVLNTTRTMTDGLANYSQQLEMQRIGNVVILTLRAVNTPINPVSLVASTSGILSQFRPARESSTTIFATYPGGSGLPVLRLTVTTGGIIQIRKLDGTAWGSGSLAYDECSITYQVA